MTASLLTARQQLSIILLFRWNGLPLSRVSKIFDLLTETTKDQDLADLKKEIAPTLSRHFSALAQREDIFRIKTVYEARGVSGARSTLLVEDRYIAATRSGVGQPDEIKAKLTDINARLSDVTNRV